MNKKSSFFSAPKSFYVHFAVMLVIMIFFRFLPPFSEMTQEGMGVLGVFLGTIYGWIFLNNMGVASVVGLIMMGTTIIYPNPAASITAAFGFPTTVMVIAAFCITAVMSDSGASLWLARRIVSIKIGAKHPMLFLILFMIAMFIIGPYAGFAGMILMFSMWRDVVRAANGDNKLVKLGISAIFLAGSVNNQCVPFTATTIVLNGVWSSFTGLPEASFIPFFCFMTLTGAVICALFLLAGKFLFKFKVEMLDTKDVDIPKEPATPYQKLVLAFVAAYIVLMCIASMNLGAVSRYLNGWGIIGLSVALLIIIVVIRPKDGKPSFHAYMAQSINWDMIMNTGIIFMFSSTMASPDIGLSATLEASLGFLTGIGGFGFILLIILIPLLATQFISNMALASMFIPICYTFSTALGLNAYALNCCMYTVSSMALATPAGSAGAALYYSYEEVDSRTAMKHGWTIVACTFIATVISYYVFGNLFFPM